MANFIKLKKKSNSASKIMLQTYCYALLYNYSKTSHSKRRRRRRRKGILYIFVCCIKEVSLYANDFLALNTHLLYYIFGMAVIFTILKK